MPRLCILFVLSCYLVFPQLAFAAWEMPPNIHQAEGIPSVHMSSWTAVDDFDGSQTGIINSMRWYGFYQDPADEPAELQRQVEFEVSWHPNISEQPYDHFGDCFFHHDAYPFIEEFPVTESYYATSDNGTKIYQYTGNLTWLFDPENYYSLNGNSYVFWVTLAYVESPPLTDQWLLLASDQHWGQYAMANPELHWWPGFEEVHLSEYDLAIALLPEPATATLLVLAGPLAALVSRKKTVHKRLPALCPKIDSLNIMCRTVHPSPISLFC